MAPAKKTTPRAASARKRASATGPADAIALLTADHAEVHQLFEQYEHLVEDGANEEERQALAERICVLLTVHAQIEEEVFYPAARDIVEKYELLDEAEVEHALAQHLIAKILDMEPEEVLYDATVKVLGECVGHHVKDEETELFPRCRSAGMDLKTLGRELAERRQELLADAEKDMG